MTGIENVGVFYTGKGLARVKPSPV